MRSLMDMSQKLAEAGGDAAILYMLPRSPAGDPRAIRPAFVYLGVPGERKWTFSALPGDISVQKTGTTSEPVPHGMWEATVPAPGGETRYYFANSADGPWSPMVPGVTTFETRSGGGHVERYDMRRRRSVWWRPGQPGGHEMRQAVASAVQPLSGATYYDSSHSIERAEIGSATHDFSYHSGYVMIEANTQPASRMRVDLDANEKVETLTLEIQRGVFGWYVAWQADINWTGNYLSSVALAPRGASSSFGYYGDGTLAEVQDCSGRRWTFRYEEVQ